MTTTRLAVTPERTATVPQVLLRRRGTVYLPDAGFTFDVLDTDSTTATGVEMLEADAAAYGWLLSAPLRGELARLDEADLIAVGSTLLDTLAHAVGADVRHVPLFRGFPASTPTDTFALLIRRLIHAGGQVEGYPCVECGLTGTTTALSPCAHLVCHSCFDPADHAACPICYRSLDADDPYLRAGDAADGRTRKRSARDRTMRLPARMRVLHLGVDAAADAAAELAVLLARPTSLGGTDSEDLDVLLAAASRTNPTWLPDVIAGRATRARVAAWLLSDPQTAALVDGVLDDATDVARTLAVLAGGSAELIDTPRLSSVPRSVRRTLLGVLERTAANGRQDLLVEQMGRRPALFKVVGQVLHPGEYATRYPHAAAAFAWLRRTDLSAATGLAEQIAVAPGASLRLSGDRLVHTSTVGVIEHALAAGDVKAAVDALTGRPGDLLRRLDHLLRIAGSSPESGLVHIAFQEAITHAPATLLTSVRSAFATRAFGDPSAPRVFLPKGGAARTHLAADWRAPVPAAVAAYVVDAIDVELVARAHALPQVELAHIDRALTGVRVPTGARTASASLVEVPRGSTLPLRGDTARLFIHWMETPEQRVDLDLSVIFVDESFRQLEVCAYTNLTAGDYAVHSGDYTSAPAPKGASEFVEIDMPAARRSGARYAIASVYSYNSVPFAELAAAFAGVMDLDGAALPKGRASRLNPFDARAVEQRFDLTGKHKAHLPLLIDLEERTWTWLDAAQGVTSDRGAVHATWNAGDRSTGAAAALMSRFATTTSMFDVAVAHAAGRTDRVQVRSGELVELYARHDGEALVDFARRIRDGRDPVDLQPAAGVADLAFCVRGDVQVQPGGSAYAVFPGQLEAAAMELIPAADVAVQLQPLT